MGFAVSTRRGAVGGTSREIGPLAILKGSACPSGEGLSGHWGTTGRLVVRRETGQE